MADKKSRNFSNVPIAIPDVVDAPTIGTATEGFESATVPFTAASTGGLATSFTAISTPGSITGSSSTSPITVSGLTGETAYTFKVYGSNPSGTWSSVQSAASNSITPLSKAFNSIATAVGTGSSTSITFSSIPQTYQHLQIRAIVKSTQNQDIFGSAPYIQFNSDTGANYTQHYLRASNLFGVTSGADVGTTNISPAIWGPSGGATIANMHGVFIADIHDYANTSKNKVVSIFTGADSNATVTNSNDGLTLGTGLWVNTSAITSITITASTGNWTTSTQFALYGIKGS